MLRAAICPFCSRPSRLACGSGPSPPRLIARSPAPPAARRGCRGLAGEPSSLPLARTSEAFVLSRGRPRPCARARPSLRASAACPRQAPAPPPVRPPSSAPRLAAVYCRPCCSAGCRAPPRRPSPLHFSKQAPGLYLLSREGTFIHILLGMCPLLLLVLAGASWCWTFLPFQLAWPSLQISLHLYFGLLLSTVIFCLLLLLLPAASTLACCFC